MKKRAQSDKKFELSYLAERALKEAVHDAITDHARTNDSMAIWRNGKVALVPAKQLLKRRSKS